MPGNNRQAGEVGGSLQTCPLECLLEESTGFSVNLSGQEAG